MRRPDSYYLGVALLLFALLMMFVAVITINVPIALFSGFLIVVARSLTGRWRP